MRGADQYRIIAAGAGWIHRRDRGRLRVEGRDSAAFLHGLLTNDVKALADGRGVYAAYLTPQGRMITDLRVHHCGDYLLASVPSTLAASLANRLDQLIFTEDVRVADVSDELAELSVIGGNAPGLLAHAFALKAFEPAQLASLPVLGHLVEGDAIVVRTDELELPSFDVFTTAGARAAAIERLQQMGAVEVPEDLLDALRIEAGRPKFGIDMTEETIPLEAGLLERAISTTKGCYVGQEIVIRVLHRGGGRVARRLVKLRFDPKVEAPPPAGTPLLRDGREVGRITSAATSPDTGHIVALGYVQRDHAEVGVALGAAGGEAEIVGFAG